MKRIGLLCLAIVLALGTLGVGYAAWTDTVYITGTVNTGNVDWEIVPGSQSQKSDDPDWNCFWDLEVGTRAPDPEGKNVATTTVVIESVAHPHLMTVTLDNAYPYYYDHIAFVVHGLGSIPLRIWKAEVWNDGTLVKTLYANDYVYLNLDGEPGNDLELYWGNGWGEQLHYCDKHDMSFELLVLQPAPQNANLSFTIKLFAIQWDEYRAGP